jgi:hypothetical protein
MKHLLTTLALALVLVAGAAAQENRGSAVAYGTLLIAKSDLWKELPSAPREYLVIRFDKPFEIEHTNWENEGGKAGKVRITEIQLDYAGEDSDLKPLLGKKVIAKGGIMERNLTRQMRPLILDVEPGNIKAGAFMLVQEEPTQAAAAAEEPRQAAAPEIAADIDYSQEPGLPVEWEEYTIQK